MDALERLAAQADAAAPPSATDGGDLMPGEKPPAAPPTVDERNLAAISFGMAAIALAASQVLEVHSFAKAWTDTTIPALAQPWAEVLSYYQIDLGGALDHPVAKALVLTAVPLAATIKEAANEYRATRSRRAAAKPQLRDREPDSPDPATGE